MVELPAAFRDAGVTAREAEVLDALGARLTNAEIAERLYISVRTVESHVSALLRKLGEPDRRALALQAQGLLAPAVVAFPPSLADPGDAQPFVGRSRELARLTDLGGVARRDGVRCGAVVIGDAGIGKTRLAAEAAARLHADGAIVLHGRCQQDALVPYLVFLEAARPLAGEGGAAELLDRLESTSVGDPGHARYRLFEEFDHVLASRRALTVLVLDDVQWIDPSGFQLLRHLQHRRERSSLLLVATGRPEATGPMHPMAALLGLPGSLEVIPLGGLSLDEADSLAASLDARDPNRTRDAWDRTGGNPFLIAELLRHGEAGESLPTAARDAIVRRVTGLGPAVFDLLTAAAVAGEAFHLDLAIAALGGDPSCHAAAADRAFGAGLVRRDPSQPGQYRFAHAIVREALLHVASPSRRSRLHLSIAEALESDRHRAAEAARHRHAALPDGDPDRARHAAVAAFDHAMASLAYEVAESFADMALDAVAAAGGGDPEQADAILRRGQARIRAADLEGGIADSRVALEAANRHDLKALRTGAVLAWAEGVPVWGRQPELRAAIEHALAAGVDDLALRAQLKARLAQLLYYEHAHSRRVALSREAIDDARRSGRTDTLAAVLATTHAALWEPAHLDERTHVAGEVVAIATAAGQPELEAQGLGWLAVDLLEAGDMRNAEDAFARHAARADRLRQRLPFRDAELWAAMRAMLAGDFEDAAEHIERARDLGEAARDPSADTMYWVQRYWLAVERGDQADMNELVEPCERIAADNIDVPAWRAALAMLHARRGDLDASTAYYGPLVHGGLDAIPRDVVWLNAMTYLAETCASLGDTEHAPHLAATLEPYADRVALIDRGLACKGSVQRFLGLLAGTLGDSAQAQQRLGTALETHERMQANPLTRRTRRELALFGDTSP
ncbi:MAG: ATP-binding protein [Acidimicrobiales bacterium]